MNIKTDSVDPVAFLYIWLNDFENIDSPDITEKLISNDVEKLYDIMCTYQSLSIETKEFLQLLHEIPNETLELLSGDRAHIKGNRKNRFFKFLAQYVRPGKGRPNNKAVAKIKKIKMELKMFAEEIFYEKC